MKCFTVEVRDAMTFIPCMVVVLDDSYLVRRGGWTAGSVLVGPMTGEEVTMRYHTHEYRSRTMRVATEYIQANIDTLKDGDVVDVEFILGISSSPKESERKLGDFDPFVYHD
jgi:hypothetical protein